MVTEYKFSFWLQINDSKYYFRHVKCHNNTTLLWWHANSYLQLQRSKSRKGRTIQAAWSSNLRAFWTFRIYQKSFKMYVSCKARKHFVGSFILLIVNYCNIIFKWLEKTKIKEMINLYTSMHWVCKKEIWRNKWHCWS